MKTLTIKNKHIELFLAGGWQLGFHVNNHIFGLSDDQNESRNVMDYASTVRSRGYTAAVMPELGIAFVREHGKKKYKDWAAVRGKRLKKMLKPVKDQQALLDKARDLNQVAVEDRTDLVNDIRLQNKYLESLIADGNAPESTRAQAESLYCAFEVEKFASASIERLTHIADAQDKFIREHKRLEHKTEKQWADAKEQAKRNNSELNRIAGLGPISERVRKLCRDNIVTTGGPITLPEFEEQVKEQHKVLKQVKKTDTYKTAMAAVKAAEVDDNQ